QFDVVQAGPLTAPRVASVDALRGFTMFWIIGADGAAKSLAEMLSGKGTILNTAGTIIAHQFEHVEWEGLRFYDLILPLFIFVTGVAIVFSLTRILEHASKFTAHWRVLRRSVLLYALGLIYYGINEGWPDIRLVWGFLCQGCITPFLSRVVTPFFCSTRAASILPSRLHIAAAVARSGGQGRRFFSAAEGLSLTDASTAAG